jgi:hypothetical protein
MFFIFRQSLILLLMVLLINGCTEQKAATSQPIKKPKSRKTNPPDMRQLPLQLGDWKGKESKMDEKLLAALQAKYVIERTYQNTDNAKVSVHIAVFSDLDFWRHDPMKCYKSAGWENLGHSEEEIRINPNKTIVVNFSSWRKNDDQLQLLFWYQLDDRVLFHEDDLTKLPSELLKKQLQPPLLKIMMTIYEVDSDTQKRTIKQFAKEIAKWMEEAPENVEEKIIDPFVEEFVN